MCTYNWEKKKEKYREVNWNPENVKVVNGRKSKTQGQFLWSYGEHNEKRVPTLLRTIYLPDWQSRNHAGAKVILQQLCVCVPERKSEHRCVYFRFMCVQGKFCKTAGTNVLQLCVLGSRQAAWVWLQVYQVVFIVQKPFHLWTWMPEDLMSSLFFFFCSFWLRHTCIVQATCQPISWAGWSSCPVAGGCPSQHPCHLLMLMAMISGTTGLDHQGRQVNCE